MYMVEETLSESNWVDNDGAPHKTYSLEAVANVTAIIETTDTSSDKVFDTVKLAEVASDTSTAVDTMPQPIDHDSLLSTARKNVVQRYLRRVTPREEYVQVKLFKDGTFPQLHVGNGFARTGAWDGALQSYRDALDSMTGELAEKRYMALFNIGVALEYSNQFEEAKKVLKEAYALEQSELILSELENVGSREREYEKLLEQA